MKVNGKLEIDSFCPIREVSVWDIIILLKKATVLNFIHYSASIAE